MYFCANVSLLCESLSRQKYSSSWSAKFELK